MTIHSDAELVETTDHPILDLIMRLRTLPERDATNLLFLEGGRFIATAEQAGATFRHIVTSLNVGVAGSIMPYEVCRQRHWRGLPRVL